jgi:chaperonin cofactor prefoldin
MKSYLLVIPFLGVMVSCSEGNKQPDEVPAETPEQIERIENTTRELEETMRSSGEELEKLQGDVDSILNKI